MSAQPTTQSAVAEQRAPAAPTLNDYISISPDMRFGKPCIAGTRIAVIDVAIWHNQLGYPAELIAAKWNLPVAGVYAAMSYYFDHREEIERRHAEDTAYAEEMRRRQGPTKLDRILAERAAMAEERAVVQPTIAEL